MKMTKKLLSLVCVIVMAFSAMALTGCSLKNDVKKIEEKIEASTMAGKYELVEMSAGSESYSKNELDALKALGYSITLELKNDGTGTLEMYGVKEDVTYDDNSMTISGSKTPFTKSGNKITFEQDNTKMVFEKAE